MEHNQALLNYLYMMEELGEKAAEEAADNPELSAHISNIRRCVADVCEDIEDDQYPEYHSDWSVLPISDARVWQADQSNHYERLYEHKGRKFKVHIVRNAYDAQSSARIFGFDQTTLKWNLVGSVPFMHWPVKAQASTYVRFPTVEEQGAFANLANELTEIVRKLMFVPE